jgi:hypothetical protein
MTPDENESGGAGAADGTPGGSEEEPFVVQAEVVNEQGAWTVYVEFWFTKGIERHRIGTYRSEQEARLASRWMAWAARRDVRPPTGF